MRETKMQQKILNNRGVFTPRHDYFRKLSIISPQRS